MSEDWERSVREHLQQVKDLKPCPFCGADIVNLTIKDDDGMGYKFIYCNECDAMYENANPDKLIEGWNRRPNQ